MPRRTVATTIQFQLGPQNTNGGIGSATSQPKSSTPFRPTRSDRRPATKFIRPFTKPNATTKVPSSMKELRGTPNSPSASAGTTVRIMPMVKPTSSTCSSWWVNWPRLSRMPCRSSPVRWITGLSGRMFSAGQVGCDDPIHVGRARGNLAHDVVDELLTVGDRQGWIPALFETDRRGSLAGEPGAADASRLMAGKNLQSIGKRQDLGPQRIEEDPGHFALPSGQIRPAHRTNEQRVSGQDKPRLIAAAFVGDHKRHAVRRMARRVHHPDDRIADFDGLPVAQRREGEFHQATVALVEAVG